MNKLKKIIVASLLCVATILVGSLAACGGNQTSGENSTPHPASTSDLKVGFCYFSDTNNGWYVAAANKDLSGALVIPSELEGHTIKYIGNSSFASSGLHNFSGCKYLTSVVIPNTVTGINDNAFSGCTSLKSVTMPTNSAGISPSAFSGCTSLESIHLPASGLGEGAFYGCTSLKSVTFAPSTDSHGVFMESAFAGCTSLENIELPKSVSGCLRGAFSGCTSLKNVTLSKSFTYFEQDVFKNCTSLQTITYEGTSAEWAKVKGIQYIPSNVTVVCLGD